MTRRLSVASIYLIGSGPIQDSSRILFVSRNWLVNMFAILVSGLFMVHSVFIYTLVIPISWATGGSVSMLSRWRKVWRSWVPIPTGVGITLLGILQWRRIRKQHQDEVAFKEWEITCYRSVPFRPLSRAWGWVSDCTIPSPARAWVYGQYSAMFAVNLDEVEHELPRYSSLADFFSRRLKEGVRPIDFSPCLVSPADGKILNAGKVTSCHIEQVKGVTYSIQAFLGDLNWQNTSANGGLKAVNVNAKHTDINQNEIKVDANDTYSRVADWNEYKKSLLMDPVNNDLYQIVIYLAPGDYHRFHSPVHCSIKYRRHFQGELLSVSPRVAGWVPELFSLNERVVYFGQWEKGFFSMTAVGATNVGSIRVHSDKSLHTNGRRWHRDIRHKGRRLNVEWEKGEEVGEFRMGSTIVILFEAPRDYSLCVQPGQKIKVGQSVTCCTDLDSRQKKRT
ncbi:phosphatidylserine decarboxylase proenzyme, mitochondrial isoform X2 [Nilaparvata lugens]|uniref:phosphatidylserine decarboxylase proenzyme, mitochondrial isoform X2 n=2 Tax=Nilaparvata lugens TaxID=108931 RepID=UPI00193CA1C2|nr:phosphatidylserine decarboxylase proenzyme, mitochondrial isoform X2 [Nilaparvata lugens]